MAGPGIVGALRDIRRLFGDGGSHPTDARLLERFAVDRDESAFAALVDRHGPMVLGVCRSVLKDGHDAEDAFQATFLVLARKAATVRAGDALGVWLYRVAFRIAVQADREAGRRRRTEAEASALAESARRGPQADLLAALHEEVDRLPARLREPVVLCYLEGRTYDEAGRALRLPPATIRGRLARARGRLAARLACQGAAGATALAAFADRPAKASVPARWAEASVGSAVHGKGSAGAEALARMFLRGALMAKGMFAGTAALAVVLGASAWCVATAGGDADGAGAAGEAPARPEGNGQSPPPPAAPAPDPGQAVEVGGRVFAPDGTPVNGANVWTTIDDDLIRPPLGATSGPDGRFVLRVPQRVWALLREEFRGGTFPWVVASAPGYGLGTGSGLSGAEGRPEIEVRLVAEGPPVEGRIVDLEGRPVAGAKVSCETVASPKGGDLDAWLAKARDRGLQAVDLDQFPAKLNATTDADGRFRLVGLGANRVANLLVSAPRVATTQIHAMTHPGPELRDVRKLAEHTETTVYHPSRFEQIVMPNKPISGVIRDQESGKPVAGLKVTGAVFDPHDGRPAPGVASTTDAEGRYRLDGLAKAPAYRLLVGRTKGVPYPSASFQVEPKEPALAPARFDFALRRGVLVRGRVTDKATGRPVVGGHAQAFAFEDNPEARRFPGYLESNLPYEQFADDGGFEVVALPGPGLIGVQAGSWQYRGVAGHETIRGYDPKTPDFFKTLPEYCYLGNFNAVFETNFSPGTESATRDVQVDPGRTVTVRVEDAEGRPVGGTKASGTTELFGTSEFDQPTAEVVVRALAPGSPRRVTVIHQGRSLIGSVLLRGHEEGPVTLKLAPWGVVAGRVVDDEGRPRGGVSLMSRGGMNPKRVEEVGVLPEGAHGGGIAVGRDGRFRVVGLVPGLKYGAHLMENGITAGDLFRDVTVEPGGEKDLGDLKQALYTDD